ncbi:polysaccharide export protein [Loktanella sp. IMCC34160]|uniref:polysaccharide biosynthesis/export family protein n=1 Tax=Loktanella sp. IMCC34160 TaxID=2510646 RepID=UPI00101D7B8E|nr:polysaccharide biosynthesis/export family protein [Loktanella sp. IMCC34160]RYG90481.1 polysaccharide export protein [Loktanella sp. IMCC34160]
MPSLVRFIVFVAILSGLSACATLPRGAGLQSEVLATSSDAQSEPTGYAVAPVTRDLLAVYDAWPGDDAQRNNWIGRVQQPANRIIAPGDTLQIVVWNAEDSGLLNAPGQRQVTLPDMRVSPSGEIFLPFVGTLRVAGMSPERARARVEEKYVEVSPSAQVQINLIEGRQSTVSLIGGVGAPGVYPLPDTDFTVMGLIAQGGGVASGLTNPQIRLHRDGRIFGTSVARMLDNPSLDTTLVGGDKVYVEGDDRYFLSLGAAGSEAIHPFPKDSVSALDALSMIGGVSDTRANPQGILILREYAQSTVRTNGQSGPPDARMVFIVDLTSADGLFSAGRFPVQSGDLIYVTESPVTAAQTVFGLIGSVFGLANQVSSN